MGRALRYTGRKQKPFTAQTARGEVEIDPAKVMDVDPIAALELLRSGEYAPARAQELREQEGQG